MTTKNDVGKDATIADERRRRRKKKREIVDVVYL
jgi:hypothetical protein